MLNINGNQPAAGFSVSWELRQKQREGKAPEYNLYMVVHDKMGKEFMRELYWSCGNLEIMLLAQRVAEVWGMDKMKYLVEMSDEASKKRGNFWEHLRSNMEKLFIKRED